MVIKRKQVLKIKRKSNTTVNNFPSLKMENYFQALPKDITKKSLLSLPFREVKEHCSSLDQGCNENFWIQYNRINYFIEPEDYLESYTAEEMVAWIDELLHHFYKKRSLVQVSSLKRFLTNLNDVKSELYKDLNDKDGHILQRFGADLELGDLVLAYIFRQIGVERYSFVSLPDQKFPTVILPYNSSEIQKIVDEMNEMNLAGLDDLKYLMNNQTTRNFLNYLIKMINKRTAYFTPKGIKYFDFDSEILRSVWKTTNGVPLYYYVFASTGMDDLKDYLYRLLSNFGRIEYIKIAQSLFE